MLFLPHSPLEEGLCSDLTHTGIFCKTQPWQEAETELAQLHGWVERTVPVPKPKGIWAASARCYSLLWPSDVDRSSVSFSKG